MERDNHYARKFFIELLTNNGEKIEEIYKKSGLEGLKREVLSRVEKSVNHGTSLKSFKNLKESIDNSRTKKDIIFLLSYHLLAADGLRIGSKNIKSNNKNKRNKNNQYY